MAKLWAENAVQYNATSTSGWLDEWLDARRWRAVLLSFQRVQQ